MVVRGRQCSFSANELHPHPHRHSRTRPRHLRRRHRRRRRPTALRKAQVIRNVVDEAVLADRLGLDFFGVGEHHRDDFAISAPEVVLAAIASRTKRIRLGSAVTVLSSDDPIRVFQRFSTLDAVSNGRAEVILGRGSFTESFPLFGYTLDDYEALFEEKLDLFAALLAPKGASVTWTGTTRAPLQASRCSRRPSRARCARGSASAAAPSRSCARRATACRSCSPSSAATRGGSRRSSTSITGRSRSSVMPSLPIGVHSPGHVAEPTSRRVEELWPALPSRCATASAPSAAGRRRPEPSSSRRSDTRRALRRLAGDGRAEDRGDCAALGVARFDMKYSAGTLPHETLMRSIELYGKRVIPRVRELLAVASAAS